MGCRIDQAEHWRARAEQAHALAEQLSDPSYRRQMEEVAAKYARMAENSEERATSSGAR